MNATPQTILETLKAAGLSEAADLVAQTIKAETGAAATEQREREERQAKEAAESRQKWDAATHEQRVLSASIPESEWAGENGDDLFQLLLSMARELDTLKKAAQ